MFICVTVSLSTCTKLNYNISHNRVLLHYEWKRNFSADVELHSKSK